MALLLGLVAGAAHVFAGPDHLAALAPVVADDRRRGLRLGALWGLGHGLGVVLLGGLGQLFRGALGAREVSAWSELGVGLLLIVMGACALWRTRARSTFPHSHRSPAFEGHGAPLAFGVGVLHGTAGVGHLLGILPSLFLTPPNAALYLAAYLTAAIASMAAFGGSLGWALNKLGPRRVPEAVRAASALCILVGAVWIVAALPQ
jgi:hypothetical protein